MKYIFLPLILAAIPSRAAMMDLPLPPIKGDGLAKLAVFNGAGKDDTLLFRSDADAAGNRFRVWGLDNGTYYGVTYGMTDEVPGQLIAFCGYEAGRNFGIYDIAIGALVFMNSEPDPTEDLAGTKTSDGMTYKKGTALLKSEQGEFTDAAKIEQFLFGFKADQEKGPKMQHSVRLGGQEKDHPADYVASKVDLTQALTSAKMFAAFEMNPHVWNPKAVTVKFENVEIEGCDTTCTADALSELEASFASFQPGLTCTDEECRDELIRFMIPEPSSGALLGLALAALLYRRAAQRQQRGGI